MLSCVGAGVEVAVKVSAQASESLGAGGQGEHCGVVIEAHDLGQRVLTLWHLAAPDLHRPFLGLRLAAEGNPKGVLAGQERTQAGEGLDGLGVGC